MARKTIDISGTQRDITNLIWDSWVGDNTPEEFTDGFSSIEAAVEAYIKAIPDMFGETPPVYYWREMNSECTLGELLTRYLEDNT